MKNLADSKIRLGTISVPLAALTVSFGLAVSSCSDAPEEASVFKSGVEQDDFAVPPTFERVESYQFEPVEFNDADFRSWSGTYRGKNRIENIVPFYVREMPKLGWKLWAIHDDFRDEKVLTFYKEDEIATIKLTKRYNKRLGAVGTVVEGRIRPRPLETFDPEDDPQSQEFVGVPSLESTASIEK